MDKTRLFDYLSQQNPLQWLELLQSAFDEMTVGQRRNVFEDVVTSNTTTLQGETLLKQIQRFYDDSIAGNYYAPFDFNSKNIGDIPEQTDEWFDTLADLLDDSTTLSGQSNHAAAVRCFRLLYDLIDRMEDGDEIVFAHEMGNWMIPTDTHAVAVAYLHSSSLTSTTEEFVEAALPLIRGESGSMFAGRIYTRAIEFANDDQKTLLKAEVERQNIKVTAQSYG